MVKCINGSRGIQCLVEKLSAKITPVCSDFVQLGTAGTAEKVTFFEPPSHPRKSSETKSFTFLLQPICHPAGRFGEDRLGGGAALSF